MFLLLLALIPAIFLIVYVYKKDKIEKEPVGLIIKLLILGALSIIPAIILEMFMEIVIGSFYEVDTFMYIVMDNLIGVALIEELVKYKAAKIGAWKHPAFNYKFDAIVYCMASALGFAALENIIYVFDGGITVAVMRAILSVPSHAIDGLIMGYFFGIAKQKEVFGDKAGRRKYLRLAVIMPMIEHGIYDAALSFDSSLAVLFFIVFVIGIDIWAILFIRKQSRIDEFLFQQPFNNLDSNMQE